MIALVVTIVVLIILATISINAVLGENGLIQKAEKASQMQANAEAADSDAVDELSEQIASRLPFNIDELEKGPNGKILVTEVTRTNHGSIESEDTLGNPV